MINFIFCHTVGVSNSSGIYWFLLVFDGCMKPVLEPLARFTQFTVHSKRCTLQIPHFTLHNANCILHIIHYITVQKREVIHTISPECKDQGASLYSLFLKSNIVIWLGVPFSTENGQDLICCMQSINHFMLVTSRKMFG